MSEPTDDDRRRARQLATGQGGGSLIDRITAALADERDRAFLEGFRAGLVEGYAAGREAVSRPRHGTPRPRGEPCPRCGARSGGAGVAGHYERCTTAPTPPVPGTEASRDA